MGIAALLCVAVLPSPGAAESPAWSKTEVLRLARSVADRQLAHPSRHAATDWTQAAFYAGLSALAQTPGGDKYDKALLQVGEKTAWQLGPRPFMADDHAVAQAYCELYAKHRRPEMIAAWRKTADQVLERPHDEPLKWEHGVGDREWAWCDALFMAPPALARLATVTGEPRYLDLCIRLWWKTTDYLYDPQERLFFRDSRYFGAREANGAKVFWSRGNGWVIAGLARVLQDTPKAHPERKRLEGLFRDMAGRLRDLQCEDGFWHASLLDPTSYPHPETSGTGFYCYALAWGINAKLLPRVDFEPCVRKAWAALTSAVGKDGRLGWVQQIGADPRAVKQTDTEVYGVGAFLLAASEVSRLTPG